jgi:hypothetical protein
MSNYIVETSSSRSVLTISDRQLAADYTEIENNGGNLSIIQDTDNEYWLKVPFQNGIEFTLYPAIRSPYPS